MRLPFPTDEEVKEFQSVWHKSTGVWLEGKELRDCAELILQLFVLGTYPDPGGKRRPDWDTTVARVPLKRGPKPKKGAGATPGQAPKA